MYVSLIFVLKCDYHLTNIARYLKFSITYAHFFIFHYFIFQYGIGWFSLHSAILLFTICCKIHNITTRCYVHVCFCLIPGNSTKCRQNSQCGCCSTCMYKLYIGLPDAPLTDQFTAQDLTSITKSKMMKDFKCTPLPRSSSKKLYFPAARWNHCTTWS